MSGGLRGLVGQGLDGRKKTFDWYVASFGPRLTAYSWTCPESGYYRFVQWGSGGGGGGGGYGGGSGAHTQTVVYVPKGQVVSIAVPGDQGSDAIVAFPTGRVIIAGSANGATAGVATGGDINLNGTNGVNTFGVAPSGGGDNGGSGGAGDGSSIAGGSGAPGYGGFRGGNGRTNGLALGATMPGGGAESLNSSVAGGLVIIVRQDGSRL